MYARVTQDSVRRQAGIKFDLMRQHWTTMLFLSLLGAHGMHM